MNTLLAGPTKDAPSLAIASARLAQLLPELEQGASRAWTGIVPDWGAGGGFAVAGVTPGSPGEDAGLETGTRVLGIDGVAVDSLGSYCAVLDRAREEGRAAMWTIARARRPVRSHDPDPDRLAALAHDQRGRRRQLRVLDCQLRA